ncbi:MAG TPA: DUF6089 family protein [Cyclobacteriaceae bacterium]|nr:DUF6089 family protein [Cyclobacteriaceae bacterium]
MKKLLCTAFALGMFGMLCAQRLSLDLQAGVANYNGDLQEKRFSFKGAKPLIGLGLSYRISPHFTVRGLGSWMQLAGSDKNNSTLTAERNLSFESRVLEAQLAVEYNIFDISEKGFTPYVFAGIAGFHFNPYAHDSSGNKVYLRPLGTEGQGLAAYPEKEIYKNKQFAIPFGAGVKLALTDRLQLGLEVGLRKLFTDYLDDVSGTYADSATLFAGRGPQAVAFAYRAGELHAGSIYPSEGTLRGNPDVKDWYYTTTFRVSYSFGGNGRNKGLGCPVNVF